MKRIYKISEKFSYPLAIILAGAEQEKSLPASRKTEYLFAFALKYGRKSGWNCEIFKDLLNLIDNVVKTGLFFLRNKNG